MQTDYKATQLFSANFKKWDSYATPRVSVITPCYNHGKYIHEMLDSMDRQTFQNFEVIIVNDGSIDDTTRILNRIRRKNTKIIHIDHCGPAGARNIGIKNAKGDLVINLDADDTLDPTFLQKCVEIMESHPNVGIVYSDVVFFGYKNERFVLPEYSLETMLRGNCIIANACFRKADWEKTGGYATAMVYGYEDYDFWLSILELGRDVYKINEPLAFYRTYEQPQVCRSGRRKKNQYQLQEMICRAFRRHMDLFNKIPHVREELLAMERHFIREKTVPLLDNTFPIFSIVTPTNKRPQLLRRAIKSVIDQSFRNWEQIIVDDANDPESARIVAEFNDQRIKYIVHEKQAGAAGARNTGIRHATGYFINFLDDDDEYLPGILEKTLNAFEEATNDPGFVWTGVTRVKDTAAGEETLVTLTWPSDFATRGHGLMASTAIGNGFGLSVKKECIEKIGYYDETLARGEDTDFIIRLSKLYNFRTVPEVLVKIHHHDNHQLTSPIFIQDKCEVYGKLIERHFDFLMRYWDTYYMHNKVYATLCYQLNKKKAGRQAMWRLIKKFPTRKIAWLDLISYELFEKDYCSSKLKTIVQKLKK